MRKATVLPAFALLAGVCGFFVRRWELATAFEAETGLPIPLAPAMFASIALAVVVVAVLALLCRGLGMNFKEGYDAAFAAKGNTVYMALMVLAGFVFAGSGALQLHATYLLLQGGSEAGALSVFSQLPVLLLGAGCIASGGALLTLGKNNYRGEGGGKFSLALLVPAYTMCVWVMSAYQARSGDPIILDYVYGLFAILGAMLATYFITSFSFGRGKPFWAALCPLGAAYFALVTLADAHSLPELLLLAALIVYFLTSTCALLFNLQRTHKAMREEPTHEE